MIQTMTKNLTPKILEIDGVQRECYTMSQVCEIADLTRAGLAKRIERLNKEYADTEQPLIKRYTRGGNAAYMTKEDVARLTEVKVKEVKEKE